jgi:hypothetical protein
MLTIHPRTTATASESLTVSSISWNRQFTRRRTMLVGSTVGFLVSFYLIDFDWMLTFLGGFFMTYFLVD